jgi:hypothetical protein
MWHFSVVSPARLKLGVELSRFAAAFPVTSMRGGVMF